MIIDNFFNIHVHVTQSSPFIRDRKKINQLKKIKPNLKPLKWKLTEASLTTWGLVIVELRMNRQYSNTFTT